MKDLLYYIVCNLVKNKDAVKIEEMKEKQQRSEITKKQGILERGDLAFL